MDGEKVDQRQALFSGASESLWTVTAAVRLKDTALLPGGKDMRDEDSKLESRDLASPAAVGPVKAVALPVVMSRWESWPVKKAERQGLNTFELWCWRRLLRVPWTAKRSNQSILKEISPEYSLEGLMLKLKIQHFDHLIQRTDSLENTLMLGKIEGKRRGW